MRILDLVVNKDGVEYLEFDNRYDEGEVKTENLKLLSFDEIMKIYEKMMLVQNADILNYEQERTYHTTGSPLAILGSMNRPVIPEPVSWFLPGISLETLRILPPRVPHIQTI